MTDEAELRRVRLWLAVFVAGLAMSGITAFPLQTELTHILRVTDRFSILRASQLSAWLETVASAVRQTDARYPFLAYGTDWLAFAHVVLAVLFVGAWRDPVRNRWLFTFGLIACSGVIPLALLAGDIRGIPPFWRLIDCSFGIFGAIPLWICRQAVVRLDRTEAYNREPVQTKRRSRRNCYAGEYWLD